MWLDLTLQMFVHLPKIPQPVKAFQPAEPVSPTLKATETRGSWIFPLNVLLPILLGTITYLPPFKGTVLEEDVYFPFSPGGICWYVTFCGGFFWFQKHTRSPVERCPHLTGQRCWSKVIFCPKPESNPDDRVDFAGWPRRCSRWGKNKSCEEGWHFPNVQEAFFVLFIRFFLRIEFFHENRMQIKIMEALCLWRFSANQISRMVTSPRCE